MNGILIATIVGSLYNLTTGFTMMPQLNSPEKIFPDDGSYKSIYKVLQSIENRIQNLESTVSMQYTSLVEGKMEYYGRKIENIEKDVTRFEAYVRIEMDKLLENISNKNFKEEITKDRTIRKIDGIYERISHKLNSIEGQVDVTNIKSQNTRETILSKLDKLEENLNIRDSDMEAEIADVAAAVDDLKASCTNMEENLLNFTRDSFKTTVKNGEKSSKKIVNQAISMFEDATKNVSADMTLLQKTIESSMNQSLDTYSKLEKAKMDLEESMNEYANKITDMYTDLWKKADVIDTTTKNLAVITNITRNEQQNGLRALTVEVGRKTTKNSQNDSIMDNQKLSELIKKIDSNFENVMSAQNLFLESCHRVQMDESQLETQISIVLDKLIDTFENKTAVGPRDIKHLEHLIRNHDSNIRKSVYHITSHLLNLIQKNSDNKDEIVEYVKSHLLHLDALHTMVQDSLYTKSTGQDKDILRELQIMHQAINKTQTSLEQINILNFYINKMLNTSESRKLTNTTKFDEVLQNTKAISFVLNSIEQTINKSYLNIFLNKNNIEMARQFGKQLNEKIQWIAEKYNTTNRKNMTDVFAETKNLSQTLLDILNLKLDSGIQTIKQIGRPINTDYVENVQLLCNDKNSNGRCDKSPVMNTHFSHSSTIPGTDDSTNWQVQSSLPINQKDDTRINIPNSTLNMVIEENSQNNKINIDTGAKGNGRRNDLPTNLSLYIIKHNFINNNTATPSEYNDSKNAYEFNEIKSKHFSNSIAVDNDQEKATLNRSSLTTPHKIHITSPNPTLINLINSNLSSGSNSSLSPKFHTNTSNNNTAATEEMNIPIEDIEQLFQTTESAAYLQTEEQLSISTTPSTTAYQKSSLDKNLVSTIFDVKNTD